MEKFRVGTLVLLCLSFLASQSVLANVEFSLTYQMKRPLEKFLRQLVVVTSHRLCALACNGANFCQSFTYHLRGRLCVLLVTDSRLLDDPSLIGVQDHVPGLDWVHGQMLHSVRGCGTAVNDVIGECLSFGPLGDGTSTTLTSQWSLPSISNLQYPVDMTLTRVQEAKVCGQGSYPLVSEDIPLREDMRYYEHTGLVPGLAYSFQLKAEYEGTVVQKEMSYSDLTPGGAPIEQEDRRATDPYSVVFTFDIIGCTEIIYYWYEPKNGDCDNACMLNFFTVPLVLRISNLEPGTGYNFSFVGEANGLNSSALVINQYTDPSFVLSMAVNEIDTKWMSFLYTMEGPGGSAIEVTYTGRNSQHSGLRQLPFALEGWLTLEELISGEEYDVELTVFGFGNHKNRPSATMSFQTRLGEFQCKPDTITATNVSISFNCSDASPVYKFTIEASDMPGGPWIVYPEGQSVVVEVTGLTPGMSFSGEVTASTAAGIEWPSFNVYTTLYTGYFTVAQTEVKGDSMTLEITFETGSGVTLLLEESSTSYSQSLAFAETTSYSIDSLTPGSIYNFTVTITGQDNTNAPTTIPARVSAYWFEQATVPIQTRIYTEEMKDEPETCTTKTFPETFPERFFLRYGVDIELERTSATTLVLDVVQSGNWQFIVFRIEEIDSGLVILDDVHVPNDPTQLMYFLETTLPIFEELPLWTDLRVTLTAKSLGVTANSTTFEYKSDTLSIIPQPSYNGDDVTFSYTSYREVIRNNLVVLFEHSEDAGDPISRVGEEFTFKCVVERVYTLTAAVYDESQNRLGFVGLFNFILGPNVRNKCTKSYVPYDPATTVFDWDAEYVMTMNYTTDAGSSYLEFEWIVPDFILRCDFDLIEAKTSVVVDSQIFTTERTTGTVELPGVSSSAFFSLEMTCFYDYLATKPTATRTFPKVTLGCGGITPEGPVSGSSSSSKAGSEANA